jgi:hypothetical protein
MQTISTLMILDRAPKGHNEKTTMDFVRRHDEYRDAPQVHACCKMNQSKRKGLYEG